MPLPLRNVAMLLPGQLARRAGLRSSVFQLSARHHYSNRHLALPAARQCSRGKLGYRESPNDMTHHAGRASFLVDLHCLRRLRPFESSENDSWLERGCRASNSKGFHPPSTLHSLKRILTRRRALSLNAARLL